MRILFVKESQSWPRTSGHDVHGFHMMLALQELGHSIGLLTSTQTTPQAIPGLKPVWIGTFGDLAQPTRPTSLPKWQEKFRSYWGIAPERPAQVAELVASQQFDAVVVVGLHVLPYLALVKDAVRVWYAADEWLLHHWSLVQWNRPASWKEMRAGIIKGLYERSFQPCTDRVWVVSRVDAKFFRHVMGARHADIVPNGVDADYYSPLPVAKKPESCVFWGRLDFEPNLDAIQWFGDHVWLKLRAKHPNAIWSVFGFGAGDSVRRLQARFQFDLVCDLPDLRTAVSENQIVVLPFVSGAGIKNKLLEAAALGMPIVASRKATNGLRLDSQPFRMAHSAKEWQAALESLWKDESQRRDLGQQAREWVLRNHTWDASARIASEGIESMRHSK